jgi:hypothetical protein
MPPVQCHQLYHTDIPTLRLGKGFVCFLKLGVLHACTFVEDAANMLSI